MTFDAAFERYRPEIYRYAYAMSKDADRSEDLVQTAMAKTFQNWEQVKNDTPKGYMMAACRNAWIDTLRLSEFKNTVQMTDDCDRYLADDCEAGIAERLEAQRRLDLVDPAIRTALPMLAHGYSYVEAGKAVGLTSAAIKSRIMRCIPHRGHSTRSLKVLGAGGGVRNHDNQ